MSEQNRREGGEAGGSLSIAIVTPEVVGCYSPARIGEYYFSLAANLVRWGHRVTLAHVIAPTEVDYDRRFPGVRQRHEAAGIGFVAAPDVPLPTIGWGVRLPWLADQWLSRQQFDVVHVPDLGGLGYYAMTARSFGRRHQKSRFIVTAFGGTLLYKDSLDSFVNDFDPLTIGHYERASVELADDVVMTSAFVAESWQAAGCAVPAATIVEPALLGVQPAITGPLRLMPGPGRRLTLVAGRPVESFVQIACRTIGALLRQGGGTLPLALRILSVDGSLSADDLQAAFQGAHQTWPWPVQFDWASWEDAAMVLPREDGLVAFLSAGELAGALQGALIAASVPVISATRTDTGELLASESVPEFTAPPLNAARIAERLRSILGSAEMPRPTPVVGRDALLDQWRQRHGRLAADPPAVAPAEPRSGQPLVTACVVHFQRPHLLAQALHSVAWQTYPSLEVVIVDDGSADEASKAYLAMLEANWSGPPLKVVRQANSYLGAARNTAWRLAQGEFVAFLDDDNAWKPEMVAVMVDAARRSRADIVTSFCEHVTGDAPLWEITPERYVGLMLFAGADPVRGLQENVYGDANALVRLSTLADTGGFTEDYGLGFEDWEFFSRAVLAGHRLVCVPDSLFWYRLTETSMLRGAARQSEFPNYMRALRPHLAAAPAHLRPLLRYAVGSRLGPAWLPEVLGAAQQERQRADLLAEQVEALTREIEALRRRSAGWR